MEDDLESEYRELTPGYLEEIRAKKRKLDLERLKRKASTNKEETTEDPTSANSQEELADITLSDGEVLPQYYGKCPKHLLGMPLEDLDPFYRERGIETFCVVTNRFSSKYIYRFSAKNSFFIFSPFNVIRRQAVKIASNQFFDYFIMLTIIVNCVFLALDSEVVESEYVFTAIYTLEMIIKMIARGFVMEQFMYLRDLWNWLDFGVVILAYVTIISSLTPSASNLNISGLRTFRVLRALKSFTIVPGLKTIVNALLQSLKPLGEVLVIMLFLVVVISLIALQAYQGVLLRKCVRVPDATDNITTDEEFNKFVSNESNWNPVEGELVVCGNATTSGICPDNYKCMQDVGLNPNHGFTNFDHFGWAMLTSFQLLTLDFWENVYNMIIRAEGAWNVLFFLLSVILGPFYLLNLLLAVVTLAYGKEHEKQTKLREMREKAKENARRRNKRRRLLLQRAKTRDLSNVTSFSDILGKQMGVGVSGNDKSSSIKHKNVDNCELKKDSSSSSMQPRKPEHNNIPGNESNQSIRQLTYRESRKNISMESSESSTSNIPRWKGWVRKQIRDFDATYCAWSCHPKCLGLQKILTRVVTSKIFEATITFSILANTLFLALDHHEIEEQFDYALNVGNYVFTAIFTLEAVVKIFALGVVNYLKNKWNVFDFLIVFLSLLEVGMSNSNVGGFSGLRTLRLMRVFRLARMWETMRKLMSIILKSLSAVAYLTIVLFMVLFIFAVIGKQLYSHRYNEPELFDGVTPRWNFVDFYHSFLLVWRVMCGEWIEPLHTCMFLADYSCIPVFLLITFIANFLVLNLFTAILLEAFNVDNLKSKQVDKKTAKLKLGVETFKKLLKKSQGRSGQGSNSITPETAVKPDLNGESIDSIQIEKIEESNATRSSSAANIFALNQKTTRRRKPYDSKFTWNNVNNSENPANILMHRRILSKQSRLSSDNSLTVQHPVTLLAMDANSTARAVTDTNLSKDENLNQKPELMKNGQAELVINNITVENKAKSRKMSWTKKYCSHCCISKNSVLDESIQSDSNQSDTIAEDNETGLPNENEETKKEEEAKEAPDCLPKL